jgi:hypothetical protein
MTVELAQVWRDKGALSEIKAEIKRASTDGWKPWEVLLPPDLLYPMIEEVSQGQFQQWSPIVLGIGVQVGGQDEIAIRFVLPEMKTSPVMVRSMPYHGGRKGDTIPVEVGHGNTL